MPSNLKTGAQNLSALPKHLVRLLCLTGDGGKSVNPRKQRSPRMVLP